MCHPVLPDRRRCGSHTLSPYVYNFFMCARSVGKMCVCVCVTPPEKTYKNWIQRPRRAEAIAPKESFRRRRRRRAAALTTNKERAASQINYIAVFFVHIYHLL